MRIQKRQSGVTLTELLVVMAVMAILMAISVPTAKKLMESFESSTGVRQLINAALSNARAIAVREQAYAGVRFQEKDDITYMVLVMHDPDVSPNGTGYAQGFRAVEGRRPMKLPEDIRVPGGTSIVFSPSGKLTIHRIQVYNKDGVDNSLNSSRDTIFNTSDNVNAGLAMFVQETFPVGVLPPNSSQDLWILTKDTSNYEQISPYTGELVIEYKK